ncbi:MAG TPA: hypothetical protein VN616_13120 [Puia sp.]|nr:hypothetical protein [Puia sp.]
MKIVLKIASVLTWFNIVFWGILVGLFLLFALQLANLPIIALVVLLSAIPLNCYAGLRLQACIRNPGLQLSHQTPAGIRFVGFIALFFGICLLFSGLSMIHDPKTALASWTEQMEQMPEMARQYPYKNVGESYFVRVGGAAVALGLLVSINIVLNLRLLRWYYLQRKNERS